jgi:Bicoid-interacting protein 3 (Bin3)
LNWGDFGITKLFEKIKHLLCDGGLFVFEPQNWESYGNKVDVSEVPPLPQRKKYRARRK